MSSVKKVRVGSPPDDPVEVAAAWEVVFEVEYAPHLKKREQFKRKIMNMPEYLNADEDGKIAFYRKHMAPFDDAYILDRERHYTPNMHGKPLPRFPGGVYGGEGDALPDVNAYQERASYMMLTSAAEHKLATAFYFGCFGEPTPVSYGPWETFLDDHGMVKCKSLSEVYKEKYGEAWEAELAKDLTAYARKIDDNSILYKDMCDTFDHFANFKHDLRYQTLWALIDRDITFIEKILKSSSTRSPPFSLRRVAPGQHAYTAEPPGVQYSSDSRHKTLRIIFEYARAVKTTLRASMLYFTFDPLNPSKESTMATVESLKRILESYEASVYPGDKLYVAIVDEMNIPDSLLGEELLALGARGIFNGTGRTDDRSLILSFLRNTALSDLTS